ncbi:MAG: DNA cytosine methyltransferase, partial [Planctomycetota bacterium]|nr:DNA cytosine methyltransferase [Planctomycetota bacterium]
MGNKTRILELFAGIGGAARAFGKRGEVVAAVDINQNARAVYALNFEHPYQVKSIQDLAHREIQELEAEIWWVSAPCQPYTRRGNQLDLADRRSAGLKHVIKLIQASPPDHLFLENVTGFNGSQARDELIRSLEKSNHNVTELNLCPTALGIPNRRPRYYLIASRKVDFQWRPGTYQPKRIVEFLDQEETERFTLDPLWASKYEAGLNIVDRLSSTSN